MAGKTAPFEVNSCLLFPAENQQVQIYLILERKMSASLTVEIRGGAGLLVD